MFNPFCIVPATLNRWLDTNEPCPRAVALLQLRPYTIPKSWKGFYFDRLDRLYFDGARNGLSASDVRTIANAHRDKRESECDANNLAALVDELRNDQLHYELHEQLISAANMIAKAASSPAFKLLKQSKKRRLNSV